MVEKNSQKDEYSNALGMRVWGSGPRGGLAAEAREKGVEGLRTRWRGGCTQSRKTY